MLHVRVLEAHEWPVLRDVRLAALRTDPDAFESTAEDEESLDEAAWVARIEQRAIAFRDGAPVGIVGWSLRDDETALGLSSMWVHPSVRGDGVADALMTLVKDMARGRAVALDLDVRADNPRARRFYERHGFRVTGEETGRRSGARLLVMRCSE